MSKISIMIEASLELARRRKREPEDAEIASICARASERDRALVEEFAYTLGDAF